MTLIIIFYYYSVDHPHLHSFPTRRSSDLTDEGAACGREAVLDERAQPLQRGCEIDSEVDSDRKSTRLNSSHVAISYAVFCLKKKSLTSGSRAMGTSHQKTG